ncbi:MAG TPA: FtsX-like permease family protein [Acidimicrobiales bacterium]|nr:FtsX-like permease family protein [Acidimicrobiales bacterium]
MTLKGLLGRKRRLFTTALAVTLGVAFMAGTLVLTDTIGKTFDDLFGDAYKNTDVQVRQVAAFEGIPGFDTSDQRGRVDASLIPALLAVDGVTHAEGDIWGYARLLGKDGDPIGRPELGAPTIGTAWSESELNPFVIVAGRAPQADDEVVVDRKSATDGKLAVGDTTRVLVQAGPQEVRIAGIAKYGRADSPGGASFVMFRQSVAQALLAQPGKFDSISLMAEPGISQRDLAARVQAVLPAGHEAVTGATVTRENQDAMREAFTFFNTFMFVFAVVALLVGAFMIFNTFSITVAQRTRENGLLRALGASRRQVLGSVLAEALVVGLLASLLGLGGGVLVAGALQSMLAGFGLDIPTGGVVFAASTVYISLIAGMGVTLVAAVSPARKAAKIPPIAAMNAEVTGSTGYGSKERVLVGLLLLVAGVGAMLAALFGDIPNTLAVLGAGVLTVFFGVSVLGRTVSLPLSRLLGAPLPRLRGASGALARENAMRNPKRTAASASALMIGVGLVGFITILASSTKASVDAAIDRAVTGDIVVTSGSGFFGGVDPGFARRLQAVPEVGAATGVRMGAAKVGDSVQRIAAIDAASGFEIIDVRPVQGRPQDLGRDGIAVYKEVADDKGLKVGDELHVLFKDTGETVLRVAMVFAEDQPLTTPYLLSTEGHEAHFADRYDAQVFVKKAPGTTTAAALAAVERVAGDYPGIKVFDQAGFKAEQGRQIDTVLGLVYALLALAIVIALLGIGNTLALSIFERTRELGLLRAVGMTRGQLRRTIRWESVLIALQGTVLGLVIGVFFGWALVAGLADQGIERFDLPVGSLAVVAVLAALAGVAAAVAPSRRAAKLNVLQAIAHQ